jgi:hypothetical protein
MTSNLLGKLQCFHCECIFDIPMYKSPSSFDYIECPQCKISERRQNYRCHENYEFKHPLGWPYNDPTIPYDC